MITVGDRSLIEEEVEDEEGGGGCFLGRSCLEMTRRGPESMNNAPFCELGNKKLRICCNFFLSSSSSGVLFGFDPALASPPLESSSETITELSSSLILFVSDEEEDDEESESVRMEEKR